MYETYYGLSANPFRLAPDPRFFYESACHKRGLAYLRYGLHQGEGFVVVTGIPGTGKSLLVQTIFAELSGRRMVVSSINNTNLEADDTLRAVANSFDVYCNDSSKASLLNALEKFLIERHRQGKRVLLIVDEAQNLPLRSLEELRMLSNFQSGDQPLIQIMMLGQQQLQQILADPKLEQLTQRVIASCHLKPLEPVETRGYIEHRLRHAGWNGRPSFTGEALGLIHHCTQGIPRLINTFCDRLLLAAYLDEKQQIDAEHLRLVLRELQNEATGVWQGINPNAVPSLSLAPLLVSPPPSPAVTPKEEQPSASVITEKKKADPISDATALELRMPKSQVYAAEAALLAKTPKTAVNGRGGSGRQATALSRQPRDEHEYAALKAQQIVSSPAKPMQDAVSEGVVDSKVIPLPSKQPRIEAEIDPSPLIDLDTNAVVARRWWFVIGMVIVITVVVLMVIMLVNGGRIGQIDLLRPLHQNHGSTTQPAPVSPGRISNDEVAANSAAVAAPRRLIEPSQPESNSVPPVEQKQVAATSASLPQTQEASDSELMDQSEAVAVATVPESSISEAELPDLLDSYVFAYESGDIGRFVDLFAANAVVDENMGRKRIGRDYGDLFQATEKRHMNINAVKWRQEGAKAQGNGEFELTVWRRGNRVPSVIKGRLDIEVAKEANKLLIQKLIHVVSR